MSPHCASPRLFHVRVFLISEISICDTVLFPLTKSWGKGGKIFGLCVWFSDLYVNNTAIEGTMDTYLSGVFLVASIIIVQSIFCFPGNSFV